MILIAVWSRAAQRVLTLHSHTYRGSVGLRLIRLIKESVLFSGVAPYLNMEQNKGRLPALGLHRGTVAALHTRRNS